MRKYWLALSVAALCLLALGGCKKRPAQPLQTKSFPIRGKIVSTDTKRGEIMLDHEAVPGFMEAMTMPYKLQDPKILSELHPGDKISATLLADYDGEIYKNARLDQVVVTAQGRPDYKPARQFHVPEKGDVVPDFKLTNQSGRTIHLNQYKGRVLLVTFVYTRCPLDDYCPKMSRSFAELNQGMEKDRALYDRTHLLSISFDPAFDSPAVLKSYGEIYTGRKSRNAFEHWEFAVPGEKDLEPLEQYFDVGVTGDGSSIVHSLSTVIVDKDGRIAEWYPGNDWKPADLLARVKQLAQV